MSPTLVGIVDYNGQTHCMEHASTVCSHREEIYSVDPERQCWCGTWVGTPTTVKHPDIATMNKVQPRRACFYPHEPSYEDGSRPGR